MLGHRREIHVVPSLEFKECWIPKPLTATTAIIDQDPVEPLMNQRERARMIFMGSDPIALPLLDFIAGEGSDRVELTGLMTQPDRRAGRGRQYKANAVKRWALERELPVWQPEKPGGEEVALFQELRVDIVLVMAYGHLLRRALLEAPRLGTFNFHTSLLPAFRGASPIQGAVAAGERETGVTLMKMVPRMDAGPIVDWEKVAIEPRETAQTLEGKLACSCVPLLRRNLDALLSGRVGLREQDESRASTTRKLTREDGALDFSRAASSLARRINALYPWPGAVVPVGEVPIKIGLADFTEASSGAEPGTVIDTGGEGLQVATGEGTLRLLELQRPGGRMLPAKTFLLGFPVPAGTRLPSRPMPELVVSEGSRANRKS